jgi:hypothetical protein
MTSPIVLIIYKCQENLPQIIEVLQTVKPKKIYVIADGPKPGEEATGAIWPYQSSQNCGSLCYTRCS